MRFTTIDPMAEKYYSVSPYAYCLNNPIKFIDPDGKIPLETIWDIGNVIYDVGAAVVSHIKGDHTIASSHWENAVLDAGAMLIPYVPAGASKVVKGAAVGVKVLDKTVGKANDVRKVVNGNSKASQKAQHVYEIVNNTTKGVEKVGVSGGKISKAGKSYRATRQVNKLNKAGGNYSSRIVKKIPAG